MTLVGCGLCLFHGSVLTALLLLAILPFSLHGEPVLEKNIDAATFLANDERLVESQRLWDRLGLSPMSMITAAATNNMTTLFMVTNEGWNEWANADGSAGGAPYSLYYNENNNNSFWREHLRHVLQFHIVPNVSLTVAQIFDGSRGDGLDTLAEFRMRVDPVAATLADTTPKTAIVDPDHLLSPVMSVDSVDGGSAASITPTIMIHILDQVIVPPYLTVNLMDRLLMNKEKDLSTSTSNIFAYTTMANLALYVGLDEQLNELSEGGMTLLVPPNRRFNRAQLDVAAMLTEEMRNYTERFVRAHMVRGNYDTTRITNEISTNMNNHSTDVGDDDSASSSLLVQSELGTSLWMTTVGGQLRFQSREVLMTNQVARNGIFHVLDQPVFPPYISDVVEFTGISFVETLYETSDCTRFFREALLTSPDIAKQFNTTSLTMFCPNRNAFEAFHKPTYNRLLEPIWIRHATEFLLNQITTPALSIADLLEQAPRNITMLNGITYELRQSGPVVRLKNTAQDQSRMIFGDLIALDGFVHIMDAALTPTAVSNSIYDHAMQTEDFSLLVENIDFVQLTDIVDRDLPLTWLAPNNAAFRRVTYNTLESGEILKRHFFRGLFFCDVIANQTSMEAANGEVHDVELRGVGPWGPEGQQIYVGGAHIYECDTLARNGIFHAIDRIIGVDFETVTPSVSPAPTSTASPTKVPAAIPTLSPTTAVPPVTVEIQRTLNQTLYGVSNLTSEDIGNWENAANYHANQYLANRTEDLNVEAVLKVVAFYVNRAIDTNDEQRVRRVLQPDVDVSATDDNNNDDDDSVTIEYTHTLLVQEVVQEEGANNLLESVLNIDELILEPFNNAEEKQSFVALLVQSGELTVDRVSDVILLEEPMPPSPMPSHRPTTSDEPTEAPTSAPKTSGAMVWAWDIPASISWVATSTLLALC